MPETFLETIAAGAPTHRCDCPAPAPEAAVAPTDPRKEQVAIPADRRLLETSLAALSTAADARSLRLAEAAAPNTRSLYLLTARLRR